MSGAIPPLPNTPSCRVSQLKRGVSSTFSYNKNVRLSLCLTKYHAMRMYPMLNQALRHEDVLVSGGIAPRILNLGTRWR
jgi:hypothetical protein